VPSIVVITLNSEQQKLIEDLLDRARLERPVIERFFAESHPEPVVVKNLETVQGDERDVVLLGIGYGPEVPGAPTMAMNFGPLNRDGGWRRLNVAITRARREMVVYTSFAPHMIDLRRTSAPALRDLRHFLEFAEQGPQALSQAIAGSLGGYESPFEAAVAEGLRERGWNIVPRVGVSRYRIDLGIVHPDRPGDYFAGVECDGAMYHSAATARDRDKVREAVLRQLGWRLVRVWSTEWWIDRRSALDQLDQDLHALLDKRREADAETDRLRAEQSSSCPSDILDNDAPVDLVPVAIAPDEQEEGARPPSENEAFSMRVASSAALASATAAEDFYRVTSFDDARVSIDADAFFEPRYAAQLASLIANVVEQESPIRDTLLVERIARAHGFLRSGNRIRDRISSLVEAAHYLEKEEDGSVFVWPDSQASATWSRSRIPATEGDSRPVEDIALKELAAAFLPGDQDDQIAVVARRFGVKRISSQARARLEQARQFHIR